MDGLRDGLTLAMVLDLVEVGEIGSGSLCVKLGKHGCGSRRFKRHRSRATLLSKLWWGHSGRAAMRGVRISALAAPIQPPPAKKVE